MTVDMRRVTWYALGALVLGLLAGAALASAQSPAIDRVVRILEPIGTLWINAVRMTIIPLVTAMLIAAVASSDSLRSLGRLGGSAVVFFVATISAVAVSTALLAPPLLSGLQIDPAAAAALRETATS